MSHFHKCCKCDASAKLGSMIVDPDKATLTLICPQGHGSWYIDYVDRWLMNMNAEKKEKEIISEEEKLAQVVEKMKAFIL
jgi:hypothetical protein